MNSKISYKNDNSSYIIYIIILFIATLGQITANIYLPSLPFIVTELHSSSAMLQLSLSVYFFGFGVSHLIYGPISDIIGRRIPLLYGVGICVFGTLICAGSISIYMFLLGRLIQGLGTGVCGSVGRSVTRDVCEGDQLARINSYIGMVMTFMLATAPMLGGYLQYYFGWRADFIFLFIYTALIWLFIFLKLPETNRKQHVSNTNVKTIIDNYASLLKNKVFLHYTICSCSAYAGLIAYITSSPFIFQNQLHLTPIEYGWLAYVIASAIFFGAYINSLMVVKIGSDKMMLYSALVMLFITSLLLILSLNSTANLFAIISCLFIFTVGASIVFINAFSAALHAFPHMAGTASALFGSLQILSGGLAAALIAEFFDHNLSLLSIFLLLCSFIIIISLRFR